MTPRQFLKVVQRPPSSVDTLKAAIAESVNHTVNTMNRTNRESVGAPGGDLEVFIAFGFSDGLLKVDVFEPSLTLSSFDWRYTVVGKLAVLGAILHTGVRHGWSPQSSLHGHPHLAQVILEARPVKP